MKIKTSDLTGPALDWAVAKCELAAGVFTSDPAVGDMPGESGAPPYMTFVASVPHLWGHGTIQVGTLNRYTGKPWVFHGPGGKYNPSSEWDLGGPLAEREHIGASYGGTAWWAVPLGHSLAVSGATELEAKMRCYVTQELGKEVDVPEELL